jgi:hypothetical protein
MSDNQDVVFRKIEMTYRDVPWCDVHQQVADDEGRCGGWVSRVKPCSVALVTLTVRWPK